MPPRTPVAKSQSLGPHHTVGTTFGSSPTMVTTQLGGTGSPASNISSSTAVDAFSSPPPSAAINSPPQSFSATTTTSAEEIFANPGSAPVPTADEPAGAEPARPTEQLPSGYVFGGPTQVPHKDPTLVRQQSAADTFAHPAQAPTMPSEKQAMSAADAFASTAPIESNPQTQAAAEAFNSQAPVPTGGPAEATASSTEDTTTPLAAQPAVAADVFGGPSPAKTDAVAPSQPSIPTQQSLMGSQSRNSITYDNAADLFAGPSPDKALPKTEVEQQTVPAAAESDARQLFGGPPTENSTSQPNAAAFFSAPTADHAAETVFAAPPSSTPTKEQQTEVPALPKEEPSATAPTSIATDSTKLDESTDEGMIDVPLSPEAVNAPSTPAEPQPAPSVNSAAQLFGLPPPPFSRK
eukprot:CAMPEP_0116569200 /NCGR_PEP_ID=MMETSP0397-20121206/16160_1 /TAXON_ID=216820 /ORGANISM="Cyclophora tenuis, Strain ECT3854" /LENGTH=407 /DNA_ID=CAMNT_0004096735 /DNA_START=21 /DNA_END=1244 /DNA_ORIENTATION=-